MKQQKSSGMAECDADSLCNLGVQKLTSLDTDAAYAALYEGKTVDAESAQRFGAPFRKSPMLRVLLAGQGLIAGMPAIWPANISFEQILGEIAIGGLPPVNSSDGRSGFVVNIGAGDGKRLDIYHKPIDPTWPLFARGDFGGLAIEHNRRFSEDGVPTASAEPLGAMPFASGKLSTALSEVNQSGRIHIAWEAALPDTIADLLRSHGAPANFDALAIDTDGHELGLLSAILEAGYAPRAICVNINPDVPPPIRLRWRQRTSHGAQGDSSSDATSHVHLEAAASAAGLAAGSADAFYALLSPRYSLLGFELGRFSRWCMRCNNRMWWVRTNLLPGTHSPTEGRRAARVGEQEAERPSLTSWEDMVHMYWSSIVTSVEGPRLQAGKILAHSASWASWRAKFDEEEATVIARRAWQEGGGLSRAFGHNPPSFASPSASRDVNAAGRAKDQDSLLPYDPMPVNGSYLAWCLHADPCPLHVVTHAPNGSLGVTGSRTGCLDASGSNGDGGGGGGQEGGSRRLPLGCELPSLGRPGGLRSARPPGAFAIPSLRPTLYAKVSQRLASSTASASALCGYAEDWARGVLERMCAAHACHHHPHSVPVLELAVSTEQGSPVQCQAVSWSWTQPSQEPMQEPKQ